MNAPLPPLALLRERFHYNPLNGAITHLQQRGPKRPGEPAGSSHGGNPVIYCEGQHSAAAVAWALFHGADPSPQHVIPIDGDRYNLRIDNLALSDEKFVRHPRFAGRKARRTLPSYRKWVKYSPNDRLWKAVHRYRLLGLFESKAEAIAAKHAAVMRDKEEQEYDA